MNRRLQCSKVTYRENIVRHSMRVILDLNLFCCWKSQLTYHSLLLLHATTLQIGLKFISEKQLWATVITLLTL